MFRPQLPCGLAGLSRFGNRVPCGLAGFSRFSPSYPVDCQDAVRSTPQYPGDWRDSVIWAPQVSYGLVSLSPYGHQVALGLEDVEGHAYQDIYFVCIYTLAAFNRRYSPAQNVKNVDLYLHLFVFSFYKNQLKCLAYDTCQYC